MKIKDKIDRTLARLGLCRVDLAAAAITDNGGLISRLNSELRELERTRGGMWTLTVTSAGPEHLTGQLVKSSLHDPNDARPRKGFRMAPKDAAPVRLIDERHDFAGPLVGLMAWIASISTKGAQ